MAGPAGGLPRSAAPGTTPGTPVSGREDGPGATTPVGEPRPLTALEVRRLGPVRRFFAVHPVASDVLVCLVVALVSVVNLASTMLIGVTTTVGPTVGPSPTGYVAVQAVSAVVGLLAITVRRRWPLPVLAVITGTVILTLMVPAGLGLPGGDAAYPFALYAVAASRRPRIAWNVFVASLLLFAAALAVLDEGVGGGLTITGGASDGSLVVDGGAAGGAMEVPGWGPFGAVDLASLLSYLLVGVIFLAVGLSVFASRERTAELVRRSQDLVAAGEQQARLAAMEERSRIAREMHDVVSHSLSVMIALADGAQASAVRSPEASAQALGLLSDTGRTALAEMRRMLGVLREGPAPGAPAGAGGPVSATGPARATAAAPAQIDATFPTASESSARPPVASAPYVPQPTAGEELTDLVVRFRAAGLPVRWQAEELPDHDGLRLAVFRLVQESLTNVLRHVPGAGSVEVVVAVPVGDDGRPERVVVTVTDDGGARLPPSASSSPGRGLVGMRERAALFGGTAEAGPYGRGWRVRVELVVPADAGPRPSDVWRLPE